MIVQKTADPETRPWSSTRRAGPNTPGSAACRTLLQQISMSRSHRVLKEWWFFIPNFWSFRDLQPVRMRLSVQQPKRVHAAANTFFRSMQVHACISPAENRAKFLCVHVCVKICGTTLTLHQRRRQLHVARTSGQTANEREQQLSLGALKPQTPGLDGSCMRARCGDRSNLQQLHREKINVSFP